MTTPANGQFWAAGERPKATIRITNSCGEQLRAADLGTAGLYLSGPRKGTRTAIKLLNCVVDRAAADRQHHFINLRAPKLADASQANFSEAVDGTITYTFGPISNEPAGTYTLGVWVKSTDDVDQQLALTDLQLGTATVETYATGPSQSSTCSDCHLGSMSGKSYQAHAFPGFSPMGNFALDATPIANCLLCHNLDGYSTNPTVRKVHGAHRGEHQAAAGVAHPEYGLGADSTLVAFGNIGFPSMPGAERDCAKCHVDDRWKAASRLGCGTCHDNVFFDTGTLTPPRSFGKPTAGACVVDNDCASFGAFASCGAAGVCERKVHPVETDDAQCASCHTADNSGISPVPGRHEVYATTRIRGLAITGAKLSGGTLPPSSFAVGDTLSVNFKLVDTLGAVVPDLKTNTKLSATIMVSGPTDDRQRTIASLSVKSAGTLSYDALSQTYTYLFPSAIPAQALAPLNTTAPFVRANGPGTYTLWLYVNEAITVNGQNIRDAANAVVDFELGDTTPLRPRQVISNASCASCHVTVQAHGGTRQKAANACGLCHTNGAVDRTVGSKGIACVTSATCPGNAAGWESCVDTNGDTVADACVITADPTPNQSIDFPVLVHDIHYARVRGGYAERNNLVSPGELSYVGFNNGLTNLNEGLFPQDIRNCKSCHEDAGGVCSATAPCGAGQACRGGTCVNVSWTTPTAHVCTSCHDEDSVFGHAALQTWIDPSGSPVETCTTCHGEGAAFSVESVHQIRSPYVPPYQREKN